MSEDEAYCVQVDQATGLSFTLSGDTVFVWGGHFPFKRLKSDVQPLSMLSTSRKEAKQMAVVAATESGSVVYWPTVFWLDKPQRIDLGFDSSEYGIGLHFVRGVFVYVSNKRIFVMKEQGIHGLACRVVDGHSGVLQKVTSLFGGWCSFMNVCSCGTENRLYLLKERNILQQWSMESEKIENDFDITNLVKKQIGSLEFTILGVSGSREFLGVLIYFKEKYLMFSFAVEEEINLNAMLDVESFIGIEIHPTEPLMLVSFLNQISLINLMPGNFGNFDFSIPLSLGNLTCCSFTSKSSILVLTTGKAFNLTLKNIGGVKVKKLPIEILQYEIESFLFDGINFAICEYSKEEIEMAVESICEQILEAKSKRFSLAAGVGLLLEEKYSKLLKLLELPIESKLIILKSLEISFASLKLWKFQNSIFSLQEKGFKDFHLNFLGESIFNLLESKSVMSRDSTRHFFRFMTGSLNDLLPILFNSFSTRRSSLNEPDQIALLNEFILIFSNLIESISSHRLNLCSKLNIPLDFESFWNNQNFKTISLNILDILESIFLSIKVIEENSHVEHVTNAYATSLVQLRSILLKNSISFLLNYLECCSIVKDKELCLRILFFLNKYNRQEKVFEIFEKFHYFDLMINQRFNFDLNCKSIEEYLNIYGKQFSFSLFDFYLSNNKLFELYSISDEYAHYLDDYLRENDQVPHSWIHFINTNNFPMALSKINSSFKDLNESKFFISLNYENRLDFVNCQNDLSILFKSKKDSTENILYDFLLKSFKNYTFLEKNISDLLNNKQITLVDLINLLSCSEKSFECFPLLNSTTDESLESLLKLLWRRIILADNWTEITKTISHSSDETKENNSSHMILTDIYLSEKDVQLFSKYFHENVIQVLENENSQIMHLFENTIISDLFK
ncbi:hypothetical protein O9G_003466 [Rozella allomycis CSF55]|uniref:Uncharacterized protein n=1 Tax=Rozella allomycis (strain CSF55) TaxID=988480 RepID=A0A075AUH2_ROZAC|nr:hypothetical protein O9G_003466 [Rozella allomycis CSF55]|eukprot:EPZ33946.1 hypothetical protein O9G_003466 [Rozella allomycis CSF55]